MDLFHQEIYGGPWLCGRASTWQARGPSSIPGLSSSKNQMAGDVKDPGELLLVSADNTDVDKLIA